MRLTALRQSPNDISKQKNFGHSKTTAKPPDGSCPQLFCKHRHISSSTGESENAGLRAASHDPVHAPGMLACSQPLSKLVTHGAGTCNNHMLPITETKNLSFKVSPLRDIRNLNRTRYKRKPGDGMQPRDARRPVDLPQPLADTHLPLTLHPLAHSPLRSYGSEEA